MEGGNVNDWTEWEHKNAKRLAEEAGGKWLSWQQKKFPEMFHWENYVSGRTCDHYNRFKEDFDLAKVGGHNAHRFSIEWSRIEPEEGKFDSGAIGHYHSVIRALKERGLEPFVTLWHWTLPLWLEQKGGVASKEFPFYFCRYVEKIVSCYKEDVKFWITLNEPTSVIACGYLIGVWPPGKRNFFLANRVYKILAKAHNLAYERIHNLSSDCCVGFANVIHSFKPYRKNNLLDKIAVFLGKYFANERMLRLTKEHNDFLTAQYYFHNRLKFPKKVRLGDKSVSDLNWEIYPEGIYDVLCDLKKYGKPIYITENGLADATDRQREKFIEDHLFWVHKAIQEGVDVRGYFHWSLMDNFEWDKGFWPRFGLVKVDYKTLERIPRKSFYYYRDFIAKSSQ